MHFILIIKVLSTTVGIHSIFPDVELYSPILWMHELNDEYLHGQLCCDFFIDFLITHPCNAYCKYYNYCVKKEN